MRNILGSAGIGMLEEYARFAVLLAFDFDGTLAPIVPDRARATPRPSTRTLLRRVSHLYPCALVTGRARADAASRVEGLGLKHVVGNHGIERDVPDPKLASANAKVVAALRRDLARLQGVEIEDKRYSASVHYRHSRTRQVAREVIQASVAKLGPEVEAVGGKLVVNVLPSGAQTKGSALRELVRLEKAHGAIYVGDDETDESAFAIRDFAVLGIRVGEAIKSAAKYYVRDQEKVDDLLARLVAIRSGGREPERRREP